MKKISLVTSYYNRKKLLYNTLKVLEKNNLSHLLEIIIVDDASNDDNRIDDFPDIFNLDIKVIRINPNEKWWINPCVPFNIGFKNMSEETDIVIIQNPECLHFGDIIKYTLENLKENIYISFGAYSIDEYKTDKINNLNFNDPNVKNRIEQIINPLLKRRAFKDGEDGWYNHSIYKNGALHFCSAITKKDLDKIGGFDEKYKNGIGYEDNDFIFRIKKSGMVVNIIDKPFVIHQHHKVTDYTKINLVEKNLFLYRNTIKKI